MNLFKQKINPERLKEIIKNGGIVPEEKEDLYKLLINNDISDEHENEIKFLVWKLIKKRNDLFDVELLSKLLNISELNVKKIFKSIPIEVKFPIALDDKGELATAYIIPLSKPSDRLTFSSNKETQEALKTIQKILKNKNYEIQNFFVIFDKNFSDKSFMLSIAAGLLLPKENIQNFAFTGVVNEEGEVFDVGYIPEKEKAAKKENLKLISPDILDTIDELVYWLGSEPVDIPFIYSIKRPEEEPISALNKIEKKIKENKPYFSIEGLENIFGIKKEDLFFNYDNWLPVLEEEQVNEENEWIKQVENFEEKLRNIYSKIDSKNRVLHLAFAVPVSLAMGLGIKLGAKKPVIIYHYQSDEYLPVIDLSDVRKLRRIKYIRKDIKNQLKNIEVDIPEKIKNNEDVAAAIWLASHSPYGDTQNYLKSNEKDWDLIKIESQDFQGDITLPYEDIKEDYWIRYVSEMYSVLNILKNDYQIQRYHFFLSVPVPIAFALGMAIGHFWEGYIYNYNFKSSDEKNKYYPVFNMKDDRLKSIF